MRKSIEKRDIIFQKTDVSVMELTLLILKILITAMMNAAEYGPYQVVITIAGNDDNAKLFPL